MVRPRHVRPRPVLAMQLLDALDDLGLADDTIVALMADHGYQLGEHSMWEKYTNWELAARVPFIIAAPHKAATHGRATTALTENVDAYPTVAALAGRARHPPSSPRPRAL